MRREYPVASTTPRGVPGGGPRSAPGFDVVGLIAALMVPPFSVSSASSVVKNHLPRRTRRNTEQKQNRPTFDQKGWNGHCWLFLPSTVLTVSGSRGL